MNPDVEITLYQTSGTKQQWRWTARAANNKILGDSGEAYTNREDALSAIGELFGGHTDVTMVWPHGKAVIRDGLPVDNHESRCPACGHNILWHLKSGCEQCSCSHTWVRN